MKKLFFSYKTILIFIPVISFVMHLRIFNLDLIGFHVWRQTQTQTVINNFYKEDFNILNPKINGKPDTDRIFRMEFPMMQWLFALVYKVFGEHIFISRTLTFIIGLFSVFGMFYLLLNIFGNKIIATIGAWTFNFSPVFYYYTVNPLPDNFALMCSIWGVAFFFKWIQHNQKIKYIFFSAMMLSLATLAKLPFVLCYSVVLVFVFTDLKNYKLKNLKSHLLHSLIYFLLLLPAIAWYAWVIPTWKGNGVIEGITNSKSGLLEILNVIGFNFFSTLPELLINYGSVLFFISGFYFLMKKKLFKHKLFPLLLIWSACVAAYFFFEMNMIEKVHDYYLLPFLPLIFIVVPYGAYQLYCSGNKYLKYTFLFLVTILPVTAFLRADTRWDTNHTGFTHEFYTYKNELRTLVPQNDLCIVGNDESTYIMLYYIDKKGWSFDKDELTEAQLTQWLNKGAKYLFLDSQMDTVSGIKKHLQEKIFDKGTLRVYKLKTVLDVK